MLGVAPTDLAPLAPVSHRAFRPGETLRSFRRATSSDRALDAKAQAHLLLSGPDRADIAVAIRADRTGTYLRCDPKYRLRAQTYVAGTPSRPIVASQDGELVLSHPNALAGRLRVWVEDDAGTVRNAFSTDRTVLISDDRAVFRNPDPEAEGARTPRS